MLARLNRFFSCCRSEESDGSYASLQSKKGSSQPRSRAKNGDKDNFRINSSGTWEKLNTETGKYDTEYSHKACTYVKK